MTPDRYLVGNGRWCCTCFPAGPPMTAEWRERIRRGCNECAGAGRIAHTPEEIVAATVAEVHASRSKQEGSR